MQGDGHYRSELHPLAVRPHYAGTSGKARQEQSCQKLRAGPRGRFHDSELPSLEVRFVLVLDVIVVVGGATAAAAAAAWASRKVLSRVSSSTTYNKLPTKLRDPNGRLARLLINPGGIRRAGHAGYKFDTFTAKNMDNVQSFFFFSCNA